METKKDIAIFSTRIARDLIQKDFKINDIKEHKQEKNRTVFYFQYTQELIEYLKQKHNIFIK